MSRQFSRTAVAPAVLATGLPATLVVDTRPFVPTPQSPAAASTAAPAPAAAKSVPTVSVEPALSASARSGQDAWRIGLAGALMVLTGLGLTTRRVFDRRPGAPRR
ncbi:hypothetical protein [Kitasatospora brasiliensis]|uniref:hypothetical protein n=1 Tax=Kitasatospora brasiliensis TaxID=3058040 RepID=UPI00292CC2B4|nr:hypothetical protein [Kitasatospora sp. K002]